MSLLPTLRNLLAADDQLATVLTGGIYRATEISRDETPDAFDEYGEVRPCGLVKLQLENAAGPLGYAGEPIISVYVYHPRSFDVLDQAVGRIYRILHRQDVTGLMDLRHIYDSPEVMDVALNCPMRETRYQATRYRG